MIFRTNELRPEPARGFGKGYPQDAAPVDNGVIQPSSPLYTNALSLSPCVGLPDGVADARDLYPKSTGTAAAATSLFQSTIGELAMISNASEAAIDQIVANCNGDIRGALKALLLVNERLEAELAEFYAAVGLDGMARGSNAVH